MRTEWTKPALAACLAFMVAGASAVTKTWDAGGGDGLWETALNWSDDAVPAAGDTMNIANGDLVTMPSVNLPAGQVINLTGGSDTKADGGAIRMNGAVWTVGAGSDIGGTAWYDLNNASFTFEDGASVSAGNWEHKGSNTFRFNLSASGFTAITPGTLRIGGGAGVSDTTWIADLANYTGSTGSVVLVDYGANAAGWTAASFKTAPQSILNPGAFTNSSIRFDDVAAQVILDIVDQLPAPPSAPTNTTYVWEENMDADPVLSSPAWVVRGGNNNYAVGGGILSMGTGAWSSLLDTTGFSDNWKGITRVDMIWRSTSVFDGGDGLGAGIWLNTDTDAPSYGAIHFDSVLETDGTQTVKIFEGYNNAIATLPGFGAGWLNLKAEIRPYENKLTYQVTDGTITNSGTLGYSPLASSGGNGLGTLFTRGGSAEFDYVKLEVNALPDQTFAVVEPASLDLLLNAASETVSTGTVNFVYGSSTNVDVWFAVSNESHPGSFSVNTAPLSLPALGSYSSGIEIEYDNSVSNLTSGSLATGLVTIAYSDAGSAVTNEITVPVSAAVTELYIWNAPAAGDFSTTGNWLGNLVPPSGSSSILFDAARSTKSCYLKSAYTIGTNQSWTASGNIGAFRAGAGAALTIQSGGRLDWVSNGSVELAQDGDNQVNITLYGGAVAKVFRSYPQSNWTHTFVASETGVSTFEIKNQLFLKGSLVVDISNYDPINGNVLVLFDYGQLAGDGVFSSVSIVGGTGTIDYAYDIGGGDLGIALIIPPLTTAQGTPFDWLGGYYSDLVVSNDYEIRDLEDTDMDGLPSWAEYKAGTNPTNSASVLAMVGVEQVAAGQYAVRWQGVSGKTYTLQSRSNLAVPGWSTVQTGIVGVEPETVVTTSVATAEAFFQVSVE